MKKIIIGFILGGILFGCIGIYGANNYKSDGIEYSPTDTSWKVSNVNQAINSLYGMKTELDNIKSLGNATASDILKGKKAVVKGSTITGTMTNRGAVTNTLNAGGSYTIPAGYHNGSGKVTANSLASQTSATATAADILKGKTAYVNGTKVTGTNDGGTKIVNLGTGNSFDVSSYEGYETFTTDNFLVETISTSSYVTGAGNPEYTGHYTISKSYNNNNGIFTVSNYSGEILATAASTTAWGKIYISLSYKVYLIY